MPLYLPFNCVFTKSTSCHVKVICIELDFYTSSWVRGSLGLAVLMVPVCCRPFLQAHSSLCRSNDEIVQVCVTCLQRVPPLSSLLTYPASTLLLHIASRKHTASIFEDGTATQGHKRQPSCTRKHVLQPKKICNILTQISTWEHCYCQCCATVALAFSSKLASQCRAETQACPSTLSLVLLCFHLCLRPMEEG